ncbi:MAG: hypothetical protein Q4G58_17350 [bacterium]|nr:hypothetical protein [bacterium]
MRKNTKLAYFLRGLGFGIVFVSAVVGISGNSKSQKGDKANTVVRDMTREEIIKKAKEIGMVEGVDMKLDAILDATATPDTGATPTSAENKEASSKPEASKAPVDTNKASAVPSKAPSKTNKPSSSDQPVDQSVVKVEDGKKLFTIKEGQPATEVVRGLVDAGLIDDEKAFHKFLQENKYLTKIIAGDHKITLDGSYKTIAKELCGYQK